MTKKRKESKKPIRKYRNSEVNLNLSTSQYVVLSNSQLKEWDKIKEAKGYENSHIYLITRRPRIALNTNELVYENGKVKGEFKIYNTDSYDFDTVDFEYNDAYPTKRLQSVFPHSEIIFYDVANDKEITKMDVSVFMRAVEKEHECQNLEVLYVGQSYAMGKRHSAQRLQNHKTLQNVLGDILEKSPHHVVELVLLSFSDESYTILFDGVSRTVQTSEDEDKAHFNKFLLNPISSSTKINTTELALIRYFQPHYNILLKDKYKPVREYKKSLHDLYELDFNQVTVAINLYSEDEPTQELLVYSTEALQSSQHFITLNLHDPTERKQLDDFFR